MTRQKRVRDPDLGNRCSIQTFKRIFYITLTVINYDENNYSIHFISCNFTSLLKLTINILVILEIIFSDTPKFSDRMDNLTVTVGRDAILECVVESLSTFKVSSTLVYICTITHFPPHSYN